MPLAEPDRWTQNTMQWDAGFHPLLNLRPGGSKIAMRNFLDFVVREDREATREAVERSLLSGSYFEAVFRINPRNGSPKVVLGRATLGVDVETSSTPTLFGVVQDITSALSYEMHPYEKAAILDTIAATMEAPVYAVDRELRYTYFNAFFALMMHRLYDTEAVLGEKAYETVLDEGRRRTVLGHLRRALSGARVVEELPIPLDDALERRYELTYSPIKSDFAIGGVTVFGARSPGAVTPK
jgi:PAS domain-containing protein